MSARDTEPVTVTELERVTRYVRIAVKRRADAEVAVWMAVAFARRCGVSWPALSAAVGASAETVRRKVREVEGSRAA